MRRLSAVVKWAGFTHPLCRRFSRGDEGDEDSPVFDATAALRRDVTTAERRVDAEGLLKKWIPNISVESMNKGRQMLVERPVDAMITSPSIQITHVEGADGREEPRKMTLSLEEALAAASNEGPSMSLVQMAERDGVAYCRIRNESRRIREALGETADESKVEEKESTTGAVTQTSVRRQGPLKDLIVHDFRVVVNDHFILWRSKKIVQDLSRRHPVKILIHSFDSPHDVVAKMRRMLQAVESAAQKWENGAVPHHHTSIGASERELSVHLTPDSEGTVVRHPSSKEWDRVSEKLQTLLGRHRARTEPAKKRNVGARDFRTDKFGRRLE